MVTATVAQSADTEHQTWFTVTYSDICKIIRMLNVHPKHRVCFCVCVCWRAHKAVCVLEEWKVRIPHTFQSFDMWPREGEGKADTSFLIRPDSPSPPLLLTERLISYLQQSALSVWHRSIHVSNCSSSLKSKSAHLLDPIGHARQYHLVWTEKIKKKKKKDASPSEVWPRAPALLPQLNVKYTSLGWQYIV